MNVPIRALIRREVDGGYSAEVPALPGCITEGESLDDLRRNLHEAVAAWMLASHDLATGRTTGAEMQGEPLTL